MPAFNFKKQFKKALWNGLHKLAGGKRQTIRAKRKNRPRVGQTAYLFTGMRTKQCSKIGQETIMEVKDIEITWSGIRLDGFEVSPFGDLDNLAKLDGFETFRNMRGFFSDEYGLPFKGDLVRW